MTTALRDYVRALLFHDNPSPLPTEETWTDMITRISTPGTAAIICEETYDYFLNVLPPKFQSRYLFAFAEGAEPLRLFWQPARLTNGASRLLAAHGLELCPCLCRQLTWHETRDFCRLAGIPLPE
jgi:hypothetical protein